MSLSNFAHRFRLAALVWVAWLASGVLSSCTPQPTNLARDGAGLGTTPFGPAQPGGSTVVGSPGATGSGGTSPGGTGPGGTNESNPNVSGVNGSNMMGVGGPPVGDDDPGADRSVPHQIEHAPAVARQQHVEDLRRRDAEHHPQIDARPHLVLSVQ